MVVSTLPGSSAALRVESHADPLRRHFRGKNVRSSDPGVVLRQLQRLRVTSCVIRKTSMGCLARWWMKQVDENVDGLHWRHGWLWSDISKPRMSDRRSSKIYAVIERPDHHCGDDLDKIFLRGVSINSASWAKYSVVDCLCLPHTTWGGRVSQECWPRIATFYANVFTEPL